MQVDVQAQRARWAVAAMFLANGFVMGAWAPQIPLLMPRHGVTERSATNRVLDTPSRTEAWEIGPARASVMLPLASARIEGSGRQLYLGLGMGMVPIEPWTPE